MRSILGITIDKNGARLNASLVERRSSRMKVQLDPAAKRILLAMLASPKTPQEVSRIYGIPIVIVWAKIRWLEELGVVRETLTFLDSSGELRRYFEAVLPVDTSDEELVVEA